jgi:hypothetical protein
MSSNVVWLSFFPGSVEAQQEGWRIDYLLVKVSLTSFGCILRPTAGGCRK